VREHAVRTRQVATERPLSGPFVNHKRPSQNSPHGDAHDIAPVADAFVVDEVDGAVFPGGGSGDGSGVGEVRYCIDANELPAVAFVGLYI